MIRDGIEDLLRAILPNLGNPAIIGGRRNAPPSLYHEKKMVDYDESTAIDLCIYRYSDIVSGLPG